jgi:hypothetical protein
MQGLRRVTVGFDAGSCRLSMPFVVQFTGVEAGHGKYIP